MKQFNRFSEASSTVAGSAVAVRVACPPRGIIAVKAISGSCINAGAAHALQLTISAGNALLTPVFWFAEVDLTNVGPVGTAFFTGAIHTPPAFIPTVGVADIAHFPLPAVSFEQDISVSIISTDLAASISRLAVFWTELCP